MKCEKCGATIHIVNSDRSSGRIWCPRCGAIYELAHKNGEYLVGKLIAIKRD